MLDVALCEEEAAPLELEAEGEEELPQEDMIATSGNNNK